MFCFSADGPFKTTIRSLKPMHDTAFVTAIEFLRVYAPAEGSFRVLDVGGRAVDNQLNLGAEIIKTFPNAEYVCMDLEAAPGVDIVQELGLGFPLPNDSFDFVISTSCFEHDPCFWVTFCEMCRVLRPKGRLYVNAPANGAYHCYPSDNWRFYGDAGQALAYWAGRQGWAVQVDESFHVLPLADFWIDFVSVWSRCELPATEFVLPQTERTRVGPLQAALRNRGLRAVHMMAATR